MFAKAQGEKWLHIELWLGVFNGTKRESREMDGHGGRFAEW